MSKELLKENLEQASTSSYGWTLYFFKMDRRSTQPFIVHKKRFRHDSDLEFYAQTLAKAVCQFQVNPIEKIQLYSGDNSKISCDKISLKNSAIEHEWNNLFHCISEPSDKKITGKYQGYILTGIPLSQYIPSITFIKMCNPVIDFKKQKNIVFHFSMEDELEIVSDTMCRLYMNTDMIIIKDYLYSFNLNMEKLFNMEKTMQKIRDNTLSDLSKANIFSNQDIFFKYAKSAVYPRSYITLSSDRIERLSHKKTRKSIANLLELNLDKHGKICLNSKTDVTKLLYYICYKLFKDEETKELLEASHVSKFTS